MEKAMIAATMTTLLLSSSHWGSSLVGGCTS